MIQIQKLSVEVADKRVLEDCSLFFEAGKIYVLMGPNGSGKSSLLYTLMGHPSYTVTEGTITYNHESILDMPTHVRSQKGMYVALQYPESIPGLPIISLLQELYAVHRGTRVTLDQFLEIVRPLLRDVGLAESMLYRAVNDGFSGGEKKRLELLQMLLIRPKLCLFDEIDSGIDVDGLLLVARALQRYKIEHPESCIVLVTHYRKIVEHLKPDMVYVMMQGSVVAQGDQHILSMIDRDGYESYEKRAE